MFELVVNAGAAGQERVRFAVSEADLDDALDYGRAERSQPLDEQVRAAAYHMVLEGSVRPIDDFADGPWVLLRRGRIVARNHLAAGVRESDLA